MTLLTVNNNVLSLQICGKVAARFHIFAVDRRTLTYNRPADIA